MGAADAAASRQAAGEGEAVSDATEKLLRLVDIAGDILPPNGEYSSDELARAVRAAMAMDNGGDALCDRIESPGRTRTPRLA